MNDIGMDFISNPEISTSKSNLVLEQNVAANLFETYNVALSSQVTLLSPTVMYQFYYRYYFNKDSIPGFLSIPKDQVDNLKMYTDWLAGINVSSVYGTAISKTIEAGIKVLNETLPI